MSEGHTAVENVREDGRKGHHSFSAYKSELCCTFHNKRVST